MGGRYTVHPLRRGDYEFGDHTVRWLGPLRLTVRQSHIAATAPVKVYPNPLNVRRYDLLLRRNRLQELGLRNTRACLVKVLSLSGCAIMLPMTISVVLTGKRQHAAIGR